MITPTYRRLFRILLFGVPALLIVIQFFPTSTPMTNPPVTGEPPWDSAETRRTFFSACGDCHSNETVYPWYSSVAPASWMIARDVAEGRKYFNVSEWDKNNRGGTKAAEEVRIGRMPIGPYLLLHPEANLNAAEKKIFIEGLINTFGRTNGGEMK